VPSPAASPEDRPPDTVDVAIQGAVPDADALAEWLASAAAELLPILEAQGELPDQGPWELSLVLCDDATIAPLNAQWRAKDVATDVLSFPMGEGPVLGDVVISVQTAAGRVDEPRWGLRDELAFLLVHGLLHLLGHDHIEEPDRLAMEAAEQALWTASGRPGSLRA
jgi:probable rRNA maturation factor